MRFGLLRVTHPAPVPKTTIELVSRMDLWVVSVYGALRAGDVMLAVVPGVLDPAPVQGMMVLCVLLVGSGHEIVLLAIVLGPGLGLQAVLLPRQPFHGDGGMVDVASPPQEGFGCDGVRGEAMHTEILIASQRHGHLFEQIEGRARLEVAHKRQASFFQQMEDHAAVTDLFQVSFLTMKFRL